MTLIIALALCWTLAACTPATPTPRAVPSAPSSGDPKQVALGYYVTQTPDGASVPQDEDGKQVRPKITDDFNQVVTSNKWWSSLIWQWHKKNPYSEPLYAHPFTFKADSTGLQLAYPTTPVVDHMRYMYPHNSDLSVGLAGLNAPDTKVARYSDWSVTAQWEAGAQQLRATMAHGAPFVYFERKGDAKARLSVNKDRAANVSVWKNEAGVLGLTVGGHHYAAFGPSGSTWVQDGDEFTSDLAGKDFWSVGVLPAKDQATLELFYRHAHAHIIGTQVTWSYDEDAARVRATFVVETELKQQSQAALNQPLIALYRHQWLNCNADYLPLSYVSPRGKMKVLAASEFTTEVPWHGVLPVLPNAAAAAPESLGFDASQLKDYVEHVYSAPELFPKGLTKIPKRDTYWIGKSLGKHSTVLQIADQLGQTEVRDHLLQALKNELQDWFDGRAPHYFYYDKKWKTLIGYPDSYMSGGQMNDHHFHYAYFVMSAAIIARYDSAWAEKWGPYIDLLISDPANWDRTNERFPFLRQMDVYAGHSWANGPSLFGEGNNQEASSEDTNFSTALILWGSITGRKAIRDLGIFLHSTQVEAIKQYWFDVDEQVMPKTFKPVTLAMVWGAGGWYNTWFDEDPNVIHGINYLPFSGGSLYHSRWPEYVKRNFGELDAINKGEIWNWRDLIIMYRALAEPKAAVRMFEEDPDYTPEFGNTRATIMHWVYNLAALGSVDTSVTANIATYSVFRQGGARHYVAFNPTNASKTVVFSDGTKLKVPARQTAMLKGERSGAAAP